MAGDLDGDGYPDLAVPGNVPPIGPADVGVARVSVLFNRSAGCRGPSTALGTQPPANGEGTAASQPQPVLQGIRARGVPVRAAVVVVGCGF